MKSIILLLSIVALTYVSFGQEIVSAPIHQLRIYEINPENRDVFHIRFRDEAHRIMKKYDFKIVSIWESESEEKLEYVYLLEWANENTMQTAWSEFMKDQEWKDIKKKTSAKYGSFVNNIQDKALKLMDYSPSKSLTRPK